MAEIPLPPLTPGVQVQATMTTSRVASNIGTPSVLTSLAELHENFGVPPGDVHTALHRMIMGVDTTDHFISKVLVQWRSSRYDRDAKGSHLLRCLVDGGHLDAAPLSTTLQFIAYFIPYCLIGLCIWSYWKIMFGSRMSRLLGKFPGPPLVPCAGNAYLFLGPPKNVLPTIAGLIKKYGRRFRLWKFHNPYVILVDGKDIEHVLSSNQHINKGRDYHQLHWMNGNGLITSGGDVWREDRKLLNPSFKYQRFDGFLDSFNKNGKILVSVLKKYFKNGDQKVDLHPALCRCTMDTIFESVLGATFNIQSESSEGYVGEGHVMYEGLKSVMMSYRTRGLKPWLCLPIVRNILGIAKIERETKKNFTKFMIKVIDGRKKSLKNNPGDDASRAFIDVLLESRSNQNLVDHAFTIFAAAFETNATAMNFLLFLLALNPACQKKVHQELDEVFNGDRRDATAKDIKELKYMEMCILETMRHFPPAPMFSRNLETDIVLDDGTLVPKGADVGIFVYEVHNDPAVFPHPEKFDPDRFLPAEVKKRHNYSYIPFSKGPRSCIGQKYAMLQMKSVLSHVLREFSVTTKMTRKDVNIIIGSIIEIDCSIFLTLSPRCGPKTMYKF